MAHIFLLSLVAALQLGQFEPDPKVRHPTIEEFKVLCLKSLKAENDKRRIEIEKRRPTRAEMARQSRQKTSRILKEIKAELALLDESEKPSSPIPIMKLLVNRAEVGQIGIPLQFERSEKLFIDDKISPAVVRVIRTIDDKTLWCQCVDSEFVWMNYSGPRVIDDTILKPTDIWLVSGIYRVGTKSVLAMEPWEHSAELRKVDE